MSKHLGALVLSVVTPMDFSDRRDDSSAWVVDIPSSLVPQAVSASNRLEVVELASVPQIAGQREIPNRVSQPTSCPFHLHAVIESELAADSFALVQLRGEPEIVREGSVIRDGITRFKVRRIARQRLVLKQGKRQVQCFLSSEESSQ